MTTSRDDSFFQQRYLEAPDRKELVFYEAGPTPAPSLALVARNHLRPEGPVTRILDLFGDLSDQDGMKDLLKFAVKDAIDQGSCQVTGLNWSKTLAPLWHVAWFSHPRQGALLLAQPIARGNEGLSPRPPVLDPGR